MEITQVNDLEKGVYGRLIGETDEFKGMRTAKRMTKIIGQAIRNRVEEAKKNQIEKVRKKEKGDLML